MTGQDILALISGGAVGFILAILGSGGSILATPLLLYVVGVSNPHIAIGTSALAVSVNAFANLIPYAWAGKVKWPCASVFAAAGVIGAMGGARLGQLVSPQIILPLFALVMLAAAVAMLRPKAIQGDPNVRITPAIGARLAGAGLATGLLSGFFGIGGGFLIVPGLMLASGMAMLNAVGSSLLSVGSFGAATAASYAFGDMVDWRIAAVFVGGGVAGGLIGAQVAARLSRQHSTLQYIFAGVVSATAIYILWRNLI
jgi:uncharacterized membrane protein YfcA